MRTDTEMVSNSCRFMLSRRLSIIKRTRRRNQSSTRSVGKDTVQMTTHGNPTRVLQRPLQMHWTPTGRHSVDTKPIDSIQPSAKDNQLQQTS